MSTNIEWTDVTDNIIAVEGGGWWCRKISPGCANCYAARLNQNAFYGGNKLAYSGAVPTLILRREIIAGWAKQRMPKKHFVASMTDVFGDWVSQEWIDEMLTGMMLAQKQTFQVLTKRPDVANLRIRDFLERKGIERLTKNIWIGTSVENQECADQRLPELLMIPAKVRFLSCEPLLSAVFLWPWIGRSGKRGYGENSGIHWVICGGESGPKARPMHPDWARSLRDQCRAAEVPFLFKQWGEFASRIVNPPDKTSVTFEFPDKEIVTRVGKKAAGRLLDGREWNEFPCNA